LQVQSFGASLQTFVDQATLAHPGLVTGFGITTVVFTLGIRFLLAGLTPPAVLASWILGGSVYAAFGPGGFALVCVYFIFGSLVTKFKMKEKEARGIAEKRSGRRGVVCLLFSNIWNFDLLGSLSVKSGSMLCHEDAYRYATI
jgi:uncharacterized membrane protein